MRISSADRSAMLTGAVYRYAESLFRTRMITGVRNVKERQIEDKKEELRQLIGNLYRALSVSSDYDVADSVGGFWIPCTHSSDASVWFVEPNVKKAGLIPSATALSKGNHFCSCLGAYFGQEAS